MDLMLATLVSLALVSAHPGAEMRDSSPPSVREKTAHRAQRTSDRMAWWRQARFGMFIHWGLYSIPEGEWQGNAGHAEWIRTTARIPVAEYEKLLARFNPVKFDADAWVQMAKDAGMKYLVITSKHHDGFCLFDSEHTEWDVMSTPFKRDILKELSEACKRHGVRFATYHSIMDWHHPDYIPKRDWEGESWREAKVGVPSLQEHVPNFDSFNVYLRSQVVEIIRKYDPGVMWFDGEWESTWTHQYGKPLYELCLKTNPRIIVNNRVDKGRGGMAGMTSGDHVGDFGTPEQEIPATGLPGVDWESCITMNRNWGWNRADKDFKTTKELVRMLVDIASKGGNFLLNIGPRPDGTFPEESVLRLREIGQWMRVNGEAIYGTEAGPFKTLAWGRCTMKRDGASTTLYLHVFDWPKDGKLVLPGLANAAIQARLLGSRASARTTVRRSGSDLVISVPASAPNEICGVVRLRVAGAPIVYEAPEIVAVSREFVNAARVELRARTGLQVRYTTDGSDPATAKSSRIYKDPLLLRATTPVKTRAFRDGKPVSGLVEATFTKVEPWPDLLPFKWDPGLHTRVFKGDWSRMPDFSRLAESQSFVAQSVALGRFAREEYVGLVFQGFLTIPKTEMFLFELTSDDGARLYIDDKLVVDNDGLHGAVTRSGTAPLQKGLHAIRVEWFNRTGDTALELRMGTLEEGPAPISGQAFGH